MSALRATIATFLLVAGADLFAARSVGFGTDAFCCLWPDRPTTNLVFSPGSFEIDCAVVAESLETIPKANVAETMGALLGFEGIYPPIVEEYAARTNGFLCLCARAFCVPELRKALPSHRQYLEQHYGTEIVRAFPSLGAESWLKAALEGEMEDFHISEDVARSGSYSFYDLVSVRITWRDPFPTSQTCEKAFRRADGTLRTMPFLADVRPVDVWEAREYTMIRLPLKGDSWFYALMPREGFSFDPIREDISSAGVWKILSVLSSVTESGVTHGPCGLALPKFAMRSHLALAPVLSHFRIPLQGLRRVAGACGVRECVQIVRFELDEQGLGAEPLVAKAAQDVLPDSVAEKRLVFDRPFLYFVYQEKTETIPVMGVFGGEE